MKNGNIIYRIVYQPQSGIACIKNTITDSKLKPLSSFKGKFLRETLITFIRDLSKDRNIGAKENDEQGADFFKIHHIIKLIKSIELDLPSS